MIAAAALPHLAVLAAGGTEKSKVPFYIVGGVFAAWAVMLGVLGLRRHDFPGTQGRARAVMGVSIVLMLAAVSTAVATSSHPGKSLAAGAGKASGNAGQGPGSPKGAASGTGSAGQPAGPGGAASALSLAADPSGQLHFNTNSLRAKAGRVTIHFTNQSPLQHNVTIQTKSGQFVAGSATIQGSSTSVTANLAPGTYTYYCSVDSHQQAGMQGTLVVS